MANETQVAVNGFKKFNDSIVRNVSMQNYIKQVLGDRAGTFVSSLTSLVKNSPQLQQCDPNTVMFACIKSASLNLSFDPNLGFAYCIPYNNGKTHTMEGQFQLGYKGVIQLALRSGQFETLNVTDVREGEFKGYDLLTGDIKLAMAEDRDNKPIIGYVAFFRLTNGFKKSLYWTKEHCEQHAKRYSQTYKSSNSFVQKSSKWATDFDAMARKTVIKQLLTKYAPMSIEMQDGIRYDQAVGRVDENGNESISYVDNGGTTNFADVAENAVAEEIPTETVDTATGEIKNECRPASQCS